MKSFHVSLSVFLSVLSKALRMYLCVFMNCVTCRVRIANQVVMDSCCRGGIVNTRFVCSRALFVRPRSPKALWRFRVRTSNSPIGRAWPHTDTPNGQSAQIYARQDIRVRGDDHFEPPKRQFKDSTALWLLRVSI